MADQPQNRAPNSAPSDRTKIIQIQDGLSPELPTESTPEQIPTTPSFSEELEAVTAQLASATQAHANSEESFNLGGNIKPAQLAKEKTPRAESATPSTTSTYVPKPVGTSPTAPVFPGHKITANEADTFSPVMPASTPRPSPQKPTPAFRSVPKSSTLSYKIWSALEFVAVTAAIFMVFFFIFNWQSYSALFQTKLDLLKGAVNSNPYIAQQVQNIKNASPEGQKPLPIVQNAEVAKKQIPDLTLEISPPDDRIIIPRINQNVPIVRVPEDKLLERDWAALEGQIQDALRHGVVHFPGTALPGQDGNVVITGHSSYFPWDPGRFHDVFALLHQVNVGDEIIVYHDQVKYRYAVYDKKVVKPSDVSVLAQTGENRLTMITCTPVGTDLNRLIVSARPILDNAVIASAN